MFARNGVMVPWQNSVRLRNNGYTDTYREAHPDSTTHPGITWPSQAFGYSGSTNRYTPKSDGRDRIDYIYHRGNTSTVTTLEAHLVGPKNSYVFNVLSSSNTDNETFLAENLNNWPSDHKAVYSKLRFSTLGTLCPCDNH